MHFTSPTFQFSDKGCICRKCETWNNSLQHILDISPFRQSIFPTIAYAVWRVDNNNNIYFLKIIISSANHAYKIKKFIKITG